jgi:hypothetical protein
MQVSPVPMTDAWIVAKLKCLVIINGALNQPRIVR